MVKHKSRDYKMSAVKYYLNNNNDIRKPVKFLIVKNLLYIDGLKDTRRPKILLEKIENLFLIKLLNNKLIKLSNY